jgi:hypothetical protein
MQHKRRVSNKDYYSRKELLLVRLAIGVMIVAVIIMYQLGKYIFYLVK